MLGRNSLAKFRAGITGGAEQMNANLNMLLLLEVKPLQLVIDWSNSTVVTMYYL